MTSDILDVGKLIFLSLVKYAFFFQNKRQNVKKNIQRQQKLNNAMKGRNQFEFPISVVANNSSGDGNWKWIKLIIVPVFINLN